MGLVRLAVVTLFLALVVGCGPRHTEGGATAHVSTPLWSPSGTRILVRVAAPGAPRPERLICISLGAASSTVLAGRSADMALEAWTWSPKGDRVAYVYLSGDQRRLAIATPEGKLLRSSRLKPSASCVGLEWDRKYGLVLVEQAVPGGTPEVGRAVSSSVLLWAPNLALVRKLALPWPVHDVALLDGDGDRLLAIAGGSCKDNAVVLNLKTGGYRQMTQLGPLRYGPGRWKYVSGRLYFMGSAGSKYTDAVYVCDLTSSAVRRIGGSSKTARFDVSGERAVLADGGKLSLVNTHTGRPSAVWREAGSLDAPVYSPDGTLLAAVLEQRQLIVRDVALRKQVLRVAPR